MTICPRCFKEIIEGEGHVCEKEEEKKNDRST